MRTSVELSNEFSTCSTATKIASRMSCCITAASRSYICFSHLLVTGNDWLVLFRMLVHDSISSSCIAQTQSFISLFTSTTLQYTTSMSQQVDSFCLCKSTSFFSLIRLSTNIIACRLFSAAESAASSRAMWALRSCTFKIFTLLSKNCDRFGTSVSRRNVLRCCSLSCRQQPILAQVVNY